MTDWHDPAHRITDADALRALYGVPGETSLAKEADHVHPLYRPFIEAAPFVLLGTSGPGGLDVSPRGDPPGFVQVADDHTLLLPDRHGNNRADSLYNLIADPRVALLFMIPGCRETLRVNGHAFISTAPALLQRCAMEGKLPRSVLVITVQTMFFQCGRALMRSSLWDPAAHVDRTTLPTPGQVLGTLSCGSIDGEAYDAALPKRQRETLY